MKLDEGEVPVKRACPGWIEAVRERYLAGGERSPCTAPTSPVVLNDFWQVQWQQLYFQQMNNPLVA